MSVVDSTGATLTKAALIAKGTQVPQATVLQFNEDIYEHYSYPGDEGDFESGKRLLIHAGHEYSENTLNAIFDKSAAKFTSVAPANGAAAGGTNITITGTGFAGNVGVHIGGAAATNVKVVNDDTITCTTPAGTAGAANIVINDDDGDVTATGAFTFQ